MRTKPFAAVFLVLTAACGGQSTETAIPAVSPPAAAPPASISPAASSPAAIAPTVEEARAFVAEVDDRLRQLWVARDEASWVNQNFITDDTESLASAGEAATAAYVGEAIVRAKRFDAIHAQLPPDVARKLLLLSTSQLVPAPSDATQRHELADIGAWMTGAYGKGQYCPPANSALRKYLKPSGPGAAKGAPPCLHVDELARVLAKSHDVNELVEAWTGWHSVGAPLKKKFARYVALANAGAREAGFADVGALWRSSYDMPPDAFEADVERLWKEVKPLYDELHCYVRGKLQAKYGKDKVKDHAPIPAELLGNMWAQEWNNIYDLVVPYPHEPSLDVSAKLKGQHWDPIKMVRQSEHFFTSLGFDPLPPTFWERSLFTRPADRDVVCHPSAWDVHWDGDMRIKVCIEPTEEYFRTLHHELGHDFYYQRYDKMPVLWQQGANDGFHEAIGDTMALSVTPQYLKSLGLLDSVPKGEGARINEQMKTALEKVAFLPFGLLIDKWRWEVFSGKVTPDQYQAEWWKLKEQYQGVVPPSPRDASDFDAGAKYHVASSTPYIRYFLARIYQFQFHKALCKAAGFTGPLDECSIHDNKAAGAKLMAMLAFGASKPWQDAMEVVGGGRQGDATAMLEYFAPLRHWLAEQNKGQTCGW